VTDAEIGQMVDNAPLVTVAQNRYGYRIDGDFYRRVTTLTGGLPKDWLGRWAAKETALYAYDHREAWQTLPRTDAIKLLKGAPYSKRDDKGDRGTAIHRTIEAVVNNQAMPDGLNEEELECAIAAEAFLEQRNSRVLASELTVFSKTHNYAGTLDLWERDENGELWILDWKTSPNIYTDMAVQQAAYHNCEFAVFDKHQLSDKVWQGKRIPWGPHMAARLGIVHVRANGATLHPIHYTERLWTVFRAAMHVKGWMLDTDSSFGKTPREQVYGEPLLSVTTTPPPEPKEAIGE
jgi:hypothetical protein